MPSLAETLRQVGYVTPQGVTGPNAPLAQQLKNYATNVIPTARQNLAQQRADIDAALTMGQGGVQIGDREAFERQMAQVPNLIGLTAYHGTPHTIKGKFDISKVGTGEGNQSYGYGMYFAENPAVAKQYRDNLSDFDWAFGGKPYDINNPAHRAAIELKQLGGNSALADTIKRYEKNIADLESRNADWAKSAAQKKKEELAVLKTGVLPQLEETSKGNLYKVDIPDEYIPNMLDWGKPLREQPQILKNLGIDIKEFDKIKAQRQAMPEKFDIDIPEELVQYEIARKLDKQLNEMGVDKSGRYFYEDLIKKYGTQKAISEALAEKGIKGIQYFDAGSRGKAAERTRNYVVFDPSNVKILEQNSKPMTRKEIIEQELEKVAK